MQQENVWRALNALPERERQVIEMRYGLHGERPYTLEEVGRPSASRASASARSRTTRCKKLQRLPEAQRLRDLQ